MTNVKNAHFAKSVKTRRRTQVKKKKEFLQAYEAVAGNKSVATRKVGISRETVYRWMNEDAIFLAEIQDVEESLIDMAESALLKNIKSGKTAEIIFYLKTKGKSRGYIETVATITKEMDDLSNFSDDELYTILGRRVTLK